MIHKSEQERIRTLLRDTITLLCRNGLTFKSEFSIEALIGITLDKDDVVLVSINEQVKPDREYPDTEDSSGDDDQLNWSKHSQDHSQRNHHHRRRRRKRIKTEDGHQSGLLDLSTPGRPDRSTPGDQRSTPAQSPPPEEAVVVKRELVDESWPPAGVVQEVTVGGGGSEDSGDHLPTYLPPGLPPLPMMNGIPFPPLPLPQSHFAQALGRLVGSIPPTLAQNMATTAASPSHKDSYTSSHTSGHTAGHSTPRAGHSYQPSSRSSLPKEAVALMTEWLRKNMHNPYPTDDIKDDFVQKTGLTFNQINYWFTNARRRLLPKWELQRSIQEQELVHQMAAQQQEQKYAHDLVASGHDRAAQHSGHDRAADGSTKLHGTPSRDDTTGGGGTTTKHA